MRHPYPLSTAETAAFKLRTEHYPQLQLDVANFGEPALGANKMEAYQGPSNLVNFILRRSMDDPRGSEVRRGIQGQNLLVQAQFMQQGGNDSAYHLRLSGSDLRLTAITGGDVLATTWRMTAPDIYAIASIADIPRVLFDEQDMNTSAHVQPVTYIQRPTVAQFSTDPALRVATALHAQERALMDQALLGQHELGQRITAYAFEQ